MKVFAIAATATTAVAQSLRGGGGGLIHVLNEGDLCKTGGVETGPNTVDNSAHCPNPLKCKPADGVMGIGGETPHYCCADKGPCEPKKGDSNSGGALLLKAEWCPESDAQLCRMMCPTPTCAGEDACAMRKGVCCDFECNIPTPDANGEDDDDCDIFDDIDADKEAQFKAEFDLLDTNDDGAVDVDENTHNVVDKFTEQYGKYCNDNKADTDKYGKWNQWGKYKDYTKDQWAALKGSGKGMVDQAKDALNDAWNKANSGKTNDVKDAVNGIFGGRRQLQDDGGQKRQQKRWNKGGRPGGGKWGGSNGWGKDQDKDCTQELTAKAADKATRVFNKLDKDGDQKISFCEYATARTKGMDSMVTVHGRFLAEEM